MEHREEIWNLLHDGAITAVRGSVPGDLTICVEIDYLTELMHPPCDSLWLTLLNCSYFEYLDWSDDRRTFNPQVLATGEAEILSATDEGGRVRVICSKGQFDVEYGDLRVSRDDGQAVSVSDLDEVATRYWDAFGRGAGK